MSVEALRHHLLHLQLITVPGGLCTTIRPQISVPAAPAACQGAQRLVCTQESLKHQQLLHLQLLREHRGLCSPMWHPLNTIGVLLQHTGEPRSYFTPTQTYRSRHVLHLQVFWQPRAAIIMSQRMADSKLMAAGMKLPHLPYQVITAEAAEILQVTVLSGCLPGADALPLSGIAASS